MVERSLGLLNCWRRLTASDTVTNCKRKEIVDQFVVCNINNEHFNLVTLLQFGGDLKARNKML
jgi:hypothetical protein